MMVWLSENTATLLLSVLLAVLLFSILHSLFCHHHCDHGCGNCPMAEDCKSKKSS